MKEEIKFKDLLERIANNYLERRIITGRKLFYRMDFFGKTSISVSMVPDTICDSGTIISDLDHYPTREEIKETFAEISKNYNKEIDFLVLIEDSNYSSSATGFEYLLIDKNSINKNLFEVDIYVDECGAKYNIFSHHSNDFFSDYFDLKSNEDELKKYLGEDVYSKLLFEAYKDLKSSLNLNKQQIESIKQTIANINKEFEKLSEEERLLLELGD